ncbi:hypothetical protein GWI33_009890, partial [Rhynchophorus ferrugineus]
QSIQLPNIVPDIDSLVANSSEQALNRLKNTPTSYNFVEYKKTELSRERLFVNPTKARIQFTSGLNPNATI